MKFDSSPDSDPPRSTRRPRSDGRQNRELILRVAKEAFGEHGAGASLDDISKRAGIGAGTLYRHFPTRQDLLQAVYRADVQMLGEAAERLTLEASPLEAVRTWLQLFVDHLATKRAIAAALVGGNQLFEENMSKIHGAVSALFTRAVDAGELRPDVNPADLLRALVGVTFFGTGADWKDGALRLVDILIQGSRP